MIVAEALNGKHQLTQKSLNSITAGWSSHRPDHYFAVNIMPCICDADAYIVGKRYNAELRHMDNECIKYGKQRNMSAK